MFIDVKARLNTVVGKLPKVLHGGNLTGEVMQLLVTNVGGMLIGLLGTILITRALGPEARGVYAWLLTLSSMAVSVALLAQYNITRKLGAEGPGESNWPALLGSLCGLNVLGTVLTLPLLVWGLAQPVGSSHVGLLLLAWLAVPLMAGSTPLSALIHLRRHTRTTLLSTFVPRLTLVGLVTLAWFCRELTLPMAVFLNMFLALLTVFAFHGWLGIPLRTWRIDRAAVHKNMHFLGAGWLAGLLIFVTPKLPLLLLPHYASLRDIGVFSLATTLLDISLMVPAAATSVLISHYTRTGNAHGKLQALKALLVLVLAMAAVGYLLAPYLLTLLFGAEFSSAVAPFRLLLLALLLQAPLAVMSGAVTAGGKAFGVLLPPLAGFLVTLSCALLTMPSAGIIGACWAIIAGYAAQLCVLAFFSRKT